MTSKVIRVRRAETIAHPAIRALIVRAVRATRYPGADPETMYRELAGMGIAADTLGVFVGSENGKARALAIGILPSTQAMMCPQVLLGYNAGKPALARAVGARVREWIAAAGYDRLIAMNLLHSDALFMRTFRHVGTPKVIGSLIELRFDPSGR